MESLNFIEMYNIKVLIKSAIPTKALVGILDFVKSSKKIHKYENLVGDTLII